MKRTSLIRRTAQASLAACAVMLAVFAPSASAETRALLTGVSSYPALPPALQLRGPRNDVTLLSASLKRQGIAERNIEILADGLPGRELPTRHNILQRIARLQTVSQAGDWVILYFSGHGSQQPQQDKQGWNERDGRDEIFLPWDIGRWDGAMGRVRNAIVDDEIGQALQKFSRAGVSVWVIFDTCHAGDMIKAIAPEETRWRMVPSQLLGVPDAPAANGKASDRHRFGMAPPPREKTPFGMSGTASGRIVAFYSSQVDEPAPEEPMPGAQGKVPNGVFTWHLSRALDGGEGRRFDDLLQAVARGYRRDQRAFPTPYAEGATASPLPFEGGIQAR